MTASLSEMCKILSEPSKVVIRYNIRLGSVEVCTLALDAVADVRYTRGAYSESLHDTIACYDATTENVTHVVHDIATDTLRWGYGNIDGMSVTGL